MSLLALSSSFLCVVVRAHISNGKSHKCFEERRRSFQLKWCCVVGGSGELCVPGGGEGTLGGDGPWPGAVRPAVLPASSSGVGVATRRCVWVRRAWALCSLSLWCYTDCCGCPQWLSSLTPCLEEGSARCPKAREEPGPGRSRSREMGLFSTRPSVLLQCWGSRRG